MLSVPHLIVIFLVALVVFGPQKLPELARNLGKIMAEFRKATGDLRGTFEEHMRELEREAQALETKKRDAARAAALNEAVLQPTIASPTPAAATEQSSVPALTPPSMSSPDGISGIGTPLPGTISTDRPTASDLKSGSEKSSSEPNQDNVHTA